VEFNEVIVLSLKVFAVGVVVIGRACEVVGPSERSGVGSWCVCSCKHFFGVKLTSGNCDKRIYIYIYIFRAWLPTGASCL
jgi:hypothetical protein